MPPTPSTFLAVLSAQDVNISRYEIECLGKLNKTTLVDGHLLFFKATPSTHMPTLSRLAYTRSILRVLCATTHHRLEAALNKVDLNRMVKGSFAASLERSGNDVPLPFSPGHFADIIWRRLKHPRADLKHPTTRIVLFLTKKQWYVCIQEWVNTERFEDRRNHLLPEPHPTGLHPRLARALVNILSTTSFIDPFCGAGGILIEGALCGCRVEGSDLDAIQINRARINLAHLGFTKVSLHVCDALLLKQKIGGIITDLPYGKNSRITDLQQTYRRFLMTASHIAPRMVVCLPEHVDTATLLRGTDWKREVAFLHYLHKSLSKRILVLNAKP